MSDEFDFDEGGDEGGGSEWMATFADMMTLLLTFFVLLLSFASMDITNFRMALGSVKDALGVEVEHPGDVTAIATSVVELSKRESTSNLQVFEEMMVSRIREMVREKGLEGTIEAVPDARGVIVRITGEILFETGEAELRPESKPTLDAVAEICRMLEYPISVEGHTDDRPIHTSRYASNWELSTARATAAMRYLVETGGIDIARMSVAGYAHMRPIASNETPEGRARNRRVEFVFIRPAEPAK
ncbi:MAG: flagellar motor protein MotB [Deltaproteobacteria bacterium]|nr:MAG: flagellar motor protein MotB [Deltaproteobacteria bacterium]